MQQYDNNEQMALAWQYIQGTGMSVFLTGKAGTGKTTFLRQLREQTPKRMVVLAPTGVAAINAQGQTIHSFFQLPFGPMVPGKQREQNKRFQMRQEKKNLIRSLDLLVIDEISMVRSDLLDAIDQEMRKYRNRALPFGGVQLLLIGDLQQLSPVAKEEEWRLLQPYYTTPYFYGSKALQQTPYVTIELTHIYRQQNRKFIDLLSAIREGNVTQDVINSLNTRYMKNFVPPIDEEWIRLTTHNHMADTYNEEQLHSLPGKSFQFAAKISGNFPETSYPTDDLLTLRKGAQVMFIKNDPSANHEYYNGKLGKVTNFTDEGVVVECKEDGSQIEVTPVVWENLKYKLDEETGDIKEEVDGKFIQYPLRLAWAITVHKSQGLTFDRAVLDINESFAHGQAYVALSRCRTLEGIVLSKPIVPRSVINDDNVTAYMNKELEEARTTASRLPEMRHDYFIRLLSEMFSFEQLRGDLLTFTRVVDEYLYKDQSDLLMLLKSVYPTVQNELISVANKFEHQYVTLVNDSTDFEHDKVLQERIFAACKYYYTKLNEIFGTIFSSTKIQIGNHTVSQQYNNSLEALQQSYKTKAGIFKRLSETPFSVTNYLSAKAKAELSVFYINNKVQKESNKKKKTEKKTEKKAKVDTKEISFKLFKEGSSIKEIAALRNLKESTIEEHLTHYFGTGDLDIDEFVGKDRQIQIIRAIDSMAGAYHIKDIKEKLPDDFTYFELKAVIAAEGL